MSSDAEEIRLLKIEVCRQGRLLDAIASHLGLSPEALTAPPSGPPADVVEALTAGNTLLAIKRWREHTNCTLAEAKVAVEQLERGIR